MTTTEQKQESNIQLDVYTSSETELKFESSEKIDFSVKLDSSLSMCNDRKNDKCNFNMSVNLESAQPTVEPLLVSEASVKSSCASPTVSAQIMTDTSCTSSNCCPPAPSPPSQSMNDVMLEKVDENVECVSTTPVVNEERNIFKKVAEYYGTPCQGERDDKLNSEGCKYPADDGPKGRENIDLEAAFKYSANDRSREKHIDSDGTCKYLASDRPKEKDNMDLNLGYRYPMPDRLKDKDIVDPNFGFKFTVNDRPKEKESDPNLKNYSQPSLNISNNVHYGTFPSGHIIMPPERAVNLSDSRCCPPSEHELSRQSNELIEEKYMKNKRLKSTSPREKEAVVTKYDMMEKMKSTAIQESPKKVLTDRDERFYKENNLEQSLMKVKKIAQMEEEAKLRERKCSKSSIPCKDKRQSRSPSYSMDVDILKSQEEMKYRRREADERLQAASNLGLTQQYLSSCLPVKPVTPLSHDRGMAVYTPDSTTNSVHSVHGYGQYDMDPNHLNIESPNSISSNEMNNNPVAEASRPPSTSLSMHQMYIDPQQMLALHYGLPQLHSSPQTTPPSKPQSSRKNTNNINHHNHRNKSVNHQQNNTMNSNTLHRSTPPTVTNPHSPVNTFVANTTSNASAASVAVHRSTPPTVNHQTQARHHQGTYSHPHHAVISQSGYHGVTQMPSVSYPPSVPVTTVIQHRMTSSESPQSQQRLGSSPCSTTSSSFYIQPSMHSHMHSSAPACSTSPSSGNCTGRMQSNQAVAGNSCSLVKLQQLTNGLDVLPTGHCGSMNPSSPINLTPPPASTHSNMATPPVAHQMIQNYKFLSNISASSPATVPCTTSSTTSSSSNRSSRGNHHPSNSSSSVARSGMSPNVTINPNLMPRYSSTPYGYQMATQPSSSAQTLQYITNGAPGFINQAQLPVRMGVMNVGQNQYSQDPTQNSMYSAAYAYGSFMR